MPFPGVGRGGGRGGTSTGSQVSLVAGVRTSMVPADPRRCPPRLPLPLQALVSLPCYIRGTGAGRVFGCNTLHGMLGAHDSRHTRCVVYGPRALVSARFSVGGRGVCCRVSCHRQARRLTSECARTAAHPGTQMHTWVLKCTACTTYTLHSCENGGYQITDKIIMYKNTRAGRRGTVGPRPARSGLGGGAPRSSQHRPPDPPGR